MYFKNRVKSISWQMGCGWWARVKEGFKISGPTQQKDGIPIIWTGEECEKNRCGEKTKSSILDALRSKRGILVFKIYEEKSFWIIITDKMGSWGCVSRRRIKWSHHDKRIWNPGGEKVNEVSQDGLLERWPRQERKEQGQAALTIMLQN